MISDQKKEAINVGSLVFISAFLGKLISIPSNMVVASVLGPSDFGLLAIVNTIIQYMSYSSLGMLMNLNREVPISYGRNDLEDVRLTYNVIFTNYSITTILSIIVLFLLWIIGVNFGEGMNITVLGLSAVIVLSSNISSFLNAYLRAEGKFIVYGQFEIVNSTILPLSTLVLAYFFSINGVLLSMAFGHIIGFLFIFFKVGWPKFVFHLSKVKTIALFKTGGLMFTSKVLDGVLLSLGVLIAVYYFSNIEVGILSFALGLIAVKKVPFAKALSITVSRKMALDAGKYGIESYDYFQKYFERTLIIFLLLCTLVVGVAFLIYNVAINLFLTKFQASVDLMLILFASIILYNTRVFIYNYLNVTNQQGLRIKSVIFGILIATCLSILLINKGYGLAGISASISLTYILMAVILIYHTFLQIFRQKKFVVIFLLKLVIATCLLTLTLFLLRDVNWFNATSVFTKYLFVFSELSIQIVVYGLSTCLVFMLLFSKFGVYQEIISLASYSFSKIKSKLPFKNKNRAIEVNLDSNEKV